MHLVKISKFKKFILLTEREKQNPFLNFLVKVEKKKSVIILVFALKKNKQN